MTIKITSDFQHDLHLSFSLNFFSFLSQGVGDRSIVPSTLFISVVSIKSRNQLQVDKTGLKDKKINFIIYNFFFLQ